MTSMDAFVVSSYAFRREVGRRTGFSKSPNFSKIYENFESHTIDPKRTKLDRKSHFYDLGVCLGVIGVLYDSESSSQLRE